MYLECDDCREEDCKHCPYIDEVLDDEDDEDDEDYEVYTYQDYLEDRADEEYHRMKDEGEI